MDTYKTPLGELKIKVFGHASLFFQFNGKNIYVDPYSEVVDYAGMAPADLILITHSHYDHYDESAFSKIETPDTVFVVSKDVGAKDPRYVVMNNNETYMYGDIQIDSVPSYNINRRNEEGNLFHPQGLGNGYILDFDGFKVYIAGDTEPIPEMKFLPELNIAFLPKNLPYTMTNDEFVELANEIRPKVLYPIHFFELDFADLVRRIDTGITIVDPRKNN